MMIRHGIFTILFATLWSCSAAAQQHQSRFVEVPARTDTAIFDLRSVRIVEPGRFTIIETDIDNPDVLRFRLKVLATLRSYCNRKADGEYPPPHDLFMFGVPDMPVKDIKVKTNKTTFGSKTYPTKGATWDIPYLKLALYFTGHKPQEDIEFFYCRNAFESEAATYSTRRSQILNGIRLKTLFDCQRALAGSFVNLNDPISTAITGPIRKQTILFEQYVSVCRAVTHEQPYIPP